MEKMLLIGLIFFLILIPLFTASPDPGAKANSILVMSNNTASVNTSGLVGYWRFEEGVGTTVKDSSGYGNNGILENSDGDEWVEGRFGQALEFDGSDDYVDCGNDSSLNTPDAITIEAWIKPFANNKRIVSKDDGSSSREYMLKIRSDNQMTIVLDF